jgi:hypothetical protein
VLTAALIRSAGSVRASANFAMGDCAMRKASGAGNGKVATECRVVDPSN